MSDTHTIILAVVVCFGIVAQFLVVLLLPIWLERDRKKSAEKRAALIESYSSAHKLGDCND